MPDWTAPVIIFGKGLTFSSEIPICFRMVRPLALRNFPVAGFGGDRFKDRFFGLEFCVSTLITYLLVCYFMLFPFGPGL